MKIRNGFVSNSSSSSFIVKAFTVKKGMLIDNDVVNKLEEFGFIKTNIHNPDEFYIPFKGSKKVDEVNLERDYNYGYDVTCNQEDILYFLFKNKISFISSIHYGDSSIIYDNRDDVYYQFIEHSKTFKYNYSNYRDDPNNKYTYLQKSDIEDIINNPEKLPIVYKVNVERWLKEEEDCNKKYGEGNEN